MRIVTVTLPLIVLALSIADPCCAVAQTVRVDTGEHGGAYPMNANTAANPCITPKEYDAINKRVAENQKLLKKNKSAEKSTSSTLFNWPLRMGNGLNDCSFYAISNYVDHDPTTGLLDYNCGTHTYDGHKGNDIATFPYPFYKLDNNQVEVIAAAPGTIIDKNDGYFDRNCAMSSATANDIIVQHADGSCALYWHMKKGSLTTKIVGQTVATGEYLGVVASSGNSTGPHLHFEVWSGSTSATLNDAYAGTCNSLNPSTWWVSQKPYTEPAVIEASVHPSLAVFPACPTTETPNEDTCFNSGAAASLYMFIRNETIGLTANLRIVNPDGSTFNSWLHNSTTNYTESYWYWNKTLPSAAGKYTFETVYNGITCSRIFHINCGILSSATVPAASTVNIYPNPTNGTLNIAMSNADNSDYQFSLRNIVGQTLLTEHAIVADNELRKTISISSLPGGIYFLSIESGNTRITRKIVKQD